MAEVEFQSHELKFRALFSSVRDLLQTSRGALGLDDKPFRLVVAVSGGEDSHVLLKVLSDLSRPENLQICVAHFDHALREESLKEAQFVARLAKTYSCEFFTERAEARPQNVNVEAWARAVRYAFLERVRTQTRSEFILTAHHKNDQAETVLFRVISGRTLSDAHNIARIDLERKLLRPLLSVSKAEIEEYSTALRLPFVLDPTNEDRTRSRNKIRHELIPLLEKEFNPQVVQTLAHLAERLSQDEVLLEAQAEKSFVLHRGPFSPIFFNSLPHAIRWRVLSHLAKQQVGEEGKKLGYRALHEVIDFLSEENSALKRFDVGFGIACEIDPKEGVRFLRTSEVEPAASLPPERLAVPGFVERQYGDGSEVSISAGIVVLNEETRRNLPELLNWTKDRSKANDPRHLAVEYFDIEKLPVSELTIRERQDGDRIRVWRRGERKLKKLFLEKGLRLTLRDRVPIVESGSSILWVPGVARSEIAPVGPESRYLLELRYYRN